MSFRVIAVLLVIAAGLIFWSLTLRNPSPAIAPSSAPAEIEMPPLLSTNVGPLTTTTSSPATEVKMKDPEAVIADLMELSMNDDAESLQRILVALDDPDPEIRKAAVEATVQFGSRDAVPILIAKANAVEDVQEKVRLLEAAEFLKLPSWTELQEAQKTKQRK